ncbi:hypothetical protein AzCIB_0307 [Azoarcus sp. CIB]|uniref:cytochrome c3 family protein n=1 Tax=Aromatoleum sp. (strain CIB) TaxID=198107 RepID=UPI00067D8A30|nr:cytochrome c3 family protein [Azoarcus sp. CIB]AKU10212.1 hypothetical protein AzCIB_0307 [Azoarcus sp. CIB]
MKNFPKFHALLLIAAALFGQATLALAQNTNAKVSNTKHNLSTSGPGTVKAATGASGTDQICVFCHTPHAANATAPGPLWNRTLSSATYTPYTSNSLDAEDILNGPIGQPGGASKLCLSCHDGTLALGAVANSPGSGTGRTLSMVGTPDGKMPTAGNTTGYTRNLGIDLTNDHPISFTFQSAAPDTDTLSKRDGEFRSPPYSVVVAGETKTVVGIRSRGTKPMLPLDHEGKVQCTSCHDPHLDASKFLRLNRFQTASSPGTSFNPSTDQICLGCHDKNKDRTGAAYLAWSNSAHANSNVATPAYQGTAATQREFPASIKVWEAGCLNCHDTHTVQGSRRLLREGTDNASVPKSGGNPAIEETCYQCHTTTTASILNVAAMTASTGVPDIRTEFTTSGNKRMPISNTDQPASAERHDIGGNFTDDVFVDCSGPTNKCGADFIERRSLLGAGNHANRHVECTDCHNPHRVLKNSLFNGKGLSTRRTHELGGVNGNVASGPLRGTWGVEPTYPALTTSTDWPNQPTTYAVKRGDPGANEDTARSNPFLTREYQLCLKCHSDYGAGTSFPALGSYTGGTASGTNGMSTYTNVAAEFAVKATDPPTSGGDQGEQGNSGTACSGGDCDPNGTSPIGGGATGNNHRSWHPVIWPTGRDVAERTRSGTSMDNFRPPFNGTKVGTQTMYCSDCHGHSGSWTQGSTASDATNAPNLAKVQGPHGSPQNFILKGVWDLTVTPSATRDTNTSGGICGRCHNPNANSGFDGSASEASHSFTTKSSRPCMRCHIAVPHGWKNKAFLVNLECVGPEGGKATGCTPVGNNTTDGTSTSTENIAPYYNSAALRIRTWQASGQWTETSCGAPNYGGKDWMSDVSGCQ